MKTNEIKNQKTNPTFFNRIKLLFESKPILTFITSAFIFCLLLNLGIIKDYAFRDAYEFIWTAKNNPNFLNEFVQSGRFLLGISCEFIYGDLCLTISDLKWVRLFSLLTAVIFSAQVFVYLLKLKQKIYVSALFAFLILTLPSLTISLGWTSTFEMPTVLNLSFFSGFLLVKSNNNKTKRVFNYSIAFVLVLISLCIYQPAATAFLIPFVFSVVLEQKFSIHKIISIICFLVITFLVYFIIFKFSLNWYNLEPANRSEINILRLPLKVILFYLREMKMLLYGSGILILPSLFLVVGTLSFLGFFYSMSQKRKNIHQFFLYIALLILILPLSYAPNLLSSSTFVCSRTIAPAAIILLFYQFIFLKELSLKNKFLKLLLLLFAFLVVIVSSKNLNVFISEIQNKEYRALKTVFNEIPLRNQKKIIIIKPRDKFLQEFKIYKRRHADEFGQVSSSRIWVPEPIFRQVFKERIDSLGIDDNLIQQKNVEVIDLGDTYDDTNVIVINLIDILKNEFDKN